MEKKKELTWIDNLKEMILASGLAFALAFIAAYWGYRDWLELQEYDVVYITNGVPIPGELVMLLKYGVAAFFVVVGIQLFAKPIRRRIKGDKSYWTAQKEKQAEWKKESEKRQADLRKRQEEEKRNLEKLRKEDPERAAEQERYKEEFARRVQEENLRKHHERRRKIREAAQNRAKKRN